MDALSTLKCKNCGADLDIRKAMDGVVVCDYCATPWPIPKNDTVPEALGYLRQGAGSLDVCRFDDAFTFYQRAAELDKNEPEAFFGMALAKFRVQYLKDEVNDRLQPICHEISDKKFADDKNYLHALELATDKQNQEYKRRATEIDEIRDEFYELKKSGLDYDCFLCVKVTALDGKSYTKDYNHANEIYYHLKDKGYKPFFSEREIKNRTGSAYEALILYALYMSECMLIVCSDEEYLQTKWVKNEYTRFLSMLDRKEKDRDAITFVFDGTPIEKLPNGKKVQGINISLPDAYSRIVDFVDKHTPEAKQKQQEEENRKRLEQQVDNEAREKLLARMEQLERSQQGATSTVGALLTRAWQEMEIKDFSQAEKYFTAVIDSDPTNGAAWRGKFLVEYKVANENEILENNLSATAIEAIVKNRNLNNALKYASDRETILHIRSFLDKIKGSLAKNKEHYISKINDLSQINNDLCNKQAEQLRNLDKLNADLEALKLEVEPKKQQLKNNKNKSSGKSCMLLAIMTVLSAVGMFFVYRIKLSVLVSIILAIVSGPVIGIAATFVIFFIIALFVKEKDDPIKGEVDKIEESIKELNAQIETCNKEIESIQNTIEANSKEKDNLNEKIAQLDMAIGRIK